MTFAEKIDFSPIPVIEVARILFGPEDRQRSTTNEVRFPDRGGMTVHPGKNKWHCHSEGVGGDAIALIQHANKCTFREALDWLRSQGFEKYLGEARKKPRTLVATYHYQDASGAVVYHVDRFDDKSFGQWREINGERVNGVGAGVYERTRSGAQWWFAKNQPRPLAEVHSFPAAAPVPYHLPELIVRPNDPVLIPAGEKDADNLLSLGLLATTNHGGEGKWWPELTPYFKDRRVFLLLDNDTPGETHCAVVGGALTGVASEIRVVRFPELPAKGDVSDFIEIRRKDGLDDKAIERELRLRFQAAPVWTPTNISPAAETSTIAATTNEEWPEPVSLPEGLSPVAPLDTALLPAAIAPWICDISERMQCPPDYIAAAALTGLGAVLGRKLGVAPEQQTDWYEVPNNWCCIVGRPGDLKSPAIGEALKPLHRLEVDARKTFDADVGAYEKDLQLWNLRRDAAETKAKTGLTNEPGRNDPVRCS